ncbi:MAG: hypothetical protein HY764_00340 [Candidatus Portnoybacteria bacterium]|nr:hypothetical protein [Candidatus Portnoybacteria bacterium]
MSLSDYLEKLQNKPKPVRVLILWISVSACMIVILSFWVASLTSNMPSQNLSKKEAGDQSSQNTQSLSDIKEQIPTLWQSLKASFNGIFESAQKETQEATQEQEKEWPKIEIESVNLDNPEQTQLP